jgi:hypothetical protein
MNANNYPPSSLYYFLFQEHRRSKGWQKWAWFIKRGVVPKISRALYSLSTPIPEILDPPLQYCTLSSLEQHILHCGLPEGAHIALLVSR